nr:hypothetical protein NCPCFENI_01099 [Cupriavidus sp.]
MEKPVEFQIEKSAFDDLSLTAQRHESVAFFDENKLSGQERLFYRVWASRLLQTGVFEPGQVMQRKNQVPSYGFVVVSGNVAVEDDDGHYLLGAGTVIGLAEGLCELPSRYNYVAHDAVSCKVIPIDVACREIGRINSGLKGICRFTVQRILGERATCPDFMR